jgi:hypothetical protein
VEVEPGITVEPGFETPLGRRRPVLLASPPFDLSLFFVGAIHTSLAASWRAVCYARAVP